MGLFIDSLEQTGAPADLTKPREGGPRAARTRAVFVANTIATQCTSVSCSSTRQLQHSFMLACVSSQSSAPHSGIAAVP